MKYSIIRNSSDPKVIGVKNGIAQVEIVENGFLNKEMYKRIISFFDSFKYWEKKVFTPDNDFNIEYATPLKNAKITDFITFNPFLISCPFILKERVKEIFDSFKLQEHYYIPVKLYEEGKLIMNLYLSYSPLMDYNIIDFNKSVFFTGTALLGKKMHTFKNISDYKDFKHKNPLVQGEEIFLNKTFDNTLDFFYSKIWRNIYIRKLKKSNWKRKINGNKYP